MENIDNPKTCPDCGNVVTDDKIYCNLCGHDFNTGQSLIGPFNFNFPPVKSFFNQKSSSLKIPGFSSLLAATISGFLYNIVAIIAKLIAFGIFYLIVYIIHFLTMSFGSMSMALLGLILSIIAIPVYYVITLLQFNLVTHAGFNKAMSIAENLSCYNHKQIMKITVSAAIINFLLYFFILLLSVLGYAYYDIFHSTGDLTNFNVKGFQLSFICISILIIIEIAISITGMIKALKPLRDFDAAKCRTCEKHYNTIMLKVPIKYETSLLNALENKNLKILQDILADKNEIFQNNYCLLKLFYCQNCKNQGVLEIITFQNRLVQEGKIEEKSTKIEQQLIYSEKFTSENFTSLHKIIQKAAKFRT